MTEETASPVGQILYLFPTIAILALYSPEKTMASHDAR
jgi:hypothetical protein